jgi:hypothetical protein
VRPARRPTSVSTTKPHAASAAALAAAEASRDAGAVVEALNARQLATSGPDDVEELRRLAERMIRLGRGAGRPGVEMWGRLWLIDAHWYVAGWRTSPRRRPACSAASSSRVAPSALAPAAHSRHAGPGPSGVRRGAPAARPGPGPAAGVGHPAVRGAAVAFGSSSATTSATTR